MNILFLISLDICSGNTFGAYIELRNIYFIFSKDSMLNTVVSKHLMKDMPSVSLYSFITFCCFEYVVVNIFNFLFKCVLKYCFLKGRHWYCFPFLLQILECLGVCNFIRLTVSSLSALHV